LSCEKSRGPLTLAVLIAFSRRAGLEQIGRPQQAADVLGSKRWCCPHYALSLSPVKGATPAVGRPEGLHYTYLKTLMILSGAYASLHPPGRL